MGSDKMNSLPGEIQNNIVTYLDVPDIFHLGQTCQKWYPSALREMYRKDAVERCLCGIKYMARHAIDEQTTDLAIQTLAGYKKFGNYDCDVNSVQLFGKTQTNPTIKIYQVSTALHWAVWMKNMRLAHTLLDKGAHPNVPSYGNVVQFLADEEILEKLEHYRQNITDVQFDLMSPIFVAFLKEDRDMLELLLRAAPSCFAVYDIQSGTEQPITILHFAAVDADADFGLLELLFDRFRKDINSYCKDEGVTPLHVALKSSSTRGMQLAVYAGANMEARSACDETPLVTGVRELSNLAEDAEVFEEHIECLRSFVELGANLNPDGRNLLLGPAGLQGEGNAVPASFQADLDGGTRWSNSNVANELVLALLPMEEGHPGLMMVRQLLLDFADQGLIFSQPAFWLPSPLYLVMGRRTQPQADWLFAFLTKMQATIHEGEAADFFLGWCDTRLWPATEAAWWPHIGSFWPTAVLPAYVKAFLQDTSELYDLLTNLPLAAPHSDMLVMPALACRKKWSWRVTLARGFEDGSLTSFNIEGDGILHLIIRSYVILQDYSAAEAIQDISRLVARGANITLQNADQHNPLQVLHLVNPNCKPDLHVLAAYLETLF